MRTRTTADFRHLFLMAANIHGSQGRGAREVALCNACNSNYGTQLSPRGRPWQKHEGLCERSDNIFLLELRLESVQRKARHGNSCWDYGACCTEICQKVSQSWASVCLTFPKPRNWGTTSVNNITVKHFEKLTKIRFCFIPGKLDRHYVWSTNHCSGSHYES